MTRRWPNEVNPRLDAWLDLDYEHSEDGAAVTLSQRPYEKHGTVANWLTSAAFDLKSDRGPDVAQVLEEAAQLVALPQPDPQALVDLHALLCNSLSPRDPFLFRWRAQADLKGRAPGAAPPQAGDLPTYWRETNKELWRAYRGVCAYLCIFFDWGLGTASTDHFVAKSGHAGLAYEWSNYRLSPFVWLELSRQGLLR